MSHPLWLLAYFPYIFGISTFVVFFLRFIAKGIDKDRWWTFPVYITIALPAFAAFLGGLIGILFLATKGK